jgi:hypothetical protein
MDEKEALPQETEHKDHHGREYAVAAVSIIGEYLAVTYSITWLAWLAALFFWLALIGYTRKYFLSTVWLKYGFRVLLAIVLAMATYRLTSNKTFSNVDAQQQEPKRPDVQQSSKGAGSPNTVIIGNNNTVINSTDPKVLARLDEIKTLVQAQQGDRATSNKLLQKYPLGYVIFDIDQKSSVFPYAADSLQWEFDWSTVKLTEDKQRKIFWLTLPNIRPKGVSRPMFIDAKVGGEKKLGQLDGTLFEDRTVRILAEILAIRPNGIVFLIGFDTSDHAPKN